MVDALNAPLHYGERKDNDGLWTVNPTRHSRHYYAVEFVRAAGE